MVVWASLGAESGGEYFAGYLIEKALSVDNVFVFALIFGFFEIPAKYQHRVLFWGVLGAIVFRAIFIGLGALLLDLVDFIVYVFGAFLVYTGIELARHSSIEAPGSQSPDFEYLKVGLALILVFVGAKMFLTDVGKLPVWISLSVIGAILAASMLASLVVQRRRSDGPPSPGSLKTTAG